MNPKKRKLLDAAYQYYIDIAFQNKTLVDVEQYISADITGYGAALDEKILSFSSFMAMVKRQQEQMNNEEIEMDLEIIPVLRKISAAEQTAIYVDEYKITLHNEGQSIPMFLRNSIVFQYQHALWKIVHWHCSKPNYTLGVTDPLHLNEWQQEKAKLEKQVAEKTADLAQKNQELALEAALERVRTRTMAMQNSSELTDAASVLFQQLKSLGGNITATGIGLCELDNPIGQFWMGSTSGLDLESIVIRHDIDPTHQNMFEAWKRAETLYIEEKIGEELQQHYQNMMNEPSFKAKIELAQKVGYQIPTRQIWHTANFKYGFLLITTTEPYQQANILPRFAQVFEQTYTRFLDLKRAEAQAKQAQIEAALEKIRSRTMAMRRSQELAKVVKLLYEQLDIFGMMGGQSDIEIYLIEEATGIATAWATDLNFNGMVDNYQLALKEFPAMKGEFARWYKTPFEERKNLLISNTSQGKEWQTILNYFESIPEMRPMTVSFRKENILQWTTNHAYFSHGFLALQAEQPTTQENLDILQRFAVVFEQTYTRFLDLQKAETQAREAQIETSIERIRAKALAMHHSQEIQEVAKVIRGELRKLGVTDILSTGIWIEHQKGQFRAWDISTIPETESQDFLLEFTYKIAAAKRHPKAHFWNIMYQNKDYFTTLSDKATLYATFNWLAEFDENSAKELTELVDAGYLTQWWHAVAAFEKGVIVVDFNEEPPAEMATILPKMAAAFDLAYRRFEDLETAEAQKQKIEKVFQENQRLLHSILPEQIAEQIRQGQQTVVKRFEQVSILFADIVGFTVLSEKLSPQKVVDMLNGLFSKFDDLTDKYHLEKIKTIGDAYMVASGVPEEKENHALVLFQFAQEMLTVIQHFNQAHNLQLEIRIGISSGPVVAGVIGKKKFAYDLWGDTVNTAARMEAYGKASSIQLAPSSYELLKNDFVFEKIQNVAIKGKGKMDVYVWSTFDSP